VFPHINILKSEMKDCSCEISDQKHAGGGGDLASSEEGRVQHQSHQSELVKQQQSGGEMERLVSDINSLYLGGIVNYLRSRSWGLQLLIRLTLREKQLSRHLTTFCLGLSVALFLCEEEIRASRAFLEFRTGALGVRNFSNFDNISGLPGREVIPNYVHYIRLQQPELRFFEAVCMKSAFMVQRPEKVFIHSDTGPPTGSHWQQLLEIPGFQEALQVTKVPMPMQVFGSEFFWNAHRADVLRILTLKKYGGIYLDNDILVINNFNRYRSFEFVLGWPDGEWIGNMLLIGHKEARFLTEFLETYKLFRPDIWYYNGGEKPVREVLSRHPHLVHNEKVRLGVTTNVAWNFYVRPGLWEPQEWQTNYDSLHLLIGHRSDIDPNYEAYPEITEKNIRWLKFSLPMMLRYFWFGQTEPLQPGEKVDMDLVNRAWLACKGEHRRLQHTKYLLQNLQ